MASHTSQERSRRRLTAIRPEIPAPSPQDSMATAYTGNTSCRHSGPVGVSTRINTVRLMRNRLTDAAASRTDHHPVLVDGGARNR